MWQPHHSTLSHRPVLCAEELLILLINFMKLSRNRQSCLTPVWKKKKKKKKKITMIILVSQFMLIGTSRENLELRNIKLLFILDDCSCKQVNISSILECE
jgi:hypothetical protein